tara:strand:- start:3393 stop:3641 length:249 start_codon:yes stop_codon:yes gene_type:complete
MNEFVSKKIGMGFAFGAFGFLAFTSLIFGATFVTAVIRGFQAALVFGGVAWLLGWFLLKGEIDKTETTSEEALTNKKVKSKE